MRKETWLAKHMKRMQKRLKQLKRQGRLRDKEIVLFGVTRDTVPIMKCFRNEQLEIIALVDNSPEKNGKYCMGKMIYSPKDYLPSRIEQSVVFICSFFFSREIEAQLENMGYKKNKNYFLFRESRNYIPVIVYEIIDLYKITAGYVFYKKIVNAYSKNHSIFLCPYPGTGDMYLIGLYFQQYLQRNQIKDYVFLVNGNVALKAARLFPIQNIVVINERKKNCLLAIYQLMEPKNPAIKPLLFWDWRVKKFANWNLMPITTNNTPLTFDEIFKHDVFELDVKTEKNIPVFPVNETEVNAFFEKNGLIKGKTVVLSPYMGMQLFELALEIWEKIAFELKQKGYSVCTNSSGEDEPPIPGTMPVFFKFADAVPIMNAAGCFIGIRSGLCDIISSSSCKMIIVYEAATSLIPKGHFGLQCMGLNQDAIEIEYDGCDDEAFLELILSQFD